MLDSSVGTTSRHLQIGPTQGGPACQIHLGLTDFFPGISEHRSQIFPYFPIVYGMRLGFPLGPLW